MSLVTQSSSAAPFVVMEADLNKEISWVQCQEKFGAFIQILTFPLRGENMPLFKKVAMRIVEITELLLSQLANKCFRFENLKYWLSGGSMLLGDFISQNEIEAFIRLAHQMNGISNDYDGEVQQKTLKKLCLWRKKFANTPVHTVLKNELFLDQEPFCDASFMQNQMVYLSDANWIRTNTFFAFFKKYRSQLCNKEMLQKISRAIRNDFCNNLVEVMFFFMLFQFRSCQRIFQTNTVNEIRKMHATYSKIQAARGNIFKKIVEDQNVSVVLMQNIDSDCMNPLAKKGFKVCYSSSKCSGVAYNTKEWERQNRTLEVEDNSDGNRTGIFLRHKKTRKLCHFITSSGGFALSALESEDCSEKPIRILGVNDVFEGSDIERIREIVFEGQSFQNSQDIYTKIHGKTSQNGVLPPQIMTTAQIESVKIIGESPSSKDHPFTDKFIIGAIRA